MANGILIDEATYYGDNEKYAGDGGSSTNMWAIEDVYDLIYAINEFCASSGDKFVYARLVNDIDFNEHTTYKYGLRESLGGDYFSHLCLYGNNHSIQNIVCINEGRLNFKRIRDCNFVNLVSINQTRFPLQSKCYNSNYYIQNCNFGIYMVNSAMYWGHSNVLSNCTFNIKGKITSGISFYNLTINQCHFNFDIIQNASCLFYVNDGDVVDTRFVNSYVTGKIKNVYNGDVTWCYKNTNEFASFYPVNSHFTFEFEQVNPNTLEIKGNAGFIDGELFGKNGSTITKASSYANMNILTTEEALNTDYLNSIGYPVIPID